MMSHRLVIGPGGSGRTHRLREWAAEVEDQSTIAWVAGSSIRAVDEREIEEAVAGGASVLVVDDLQWLTDGGLSAVSEFARTKPVWGSRRPWPSTERLRRLDDQLTSQGQAERTGMLASADFGSFLASLQGKAAKGELVDNLMASTGGSVGLAADSIATNWDGNVDQIPEALLDAVMTRVRKAGPDAVALALVLAVEPTIEPGLAARALPSGVEARGAQRGLRSGGLADGDGGLLEIVAASIRADLTSVELEEIHDRLGSTMSIADPDRAADHLRAGTLNSPTSLDALVASAERIRRSNPARAIELVSDIADAQTGDSAGDVAERGALVRAEAAFHLGSATAIGELENSGVASVAPRAALLGFGHDVRELRWSSAASRSLPPEVGPQLQAIAQAAVGNVEPAETLPEASGPLSAMLTLAASGCAAIAAGDNAEGLSQLAAASDDYQRLQPDLPLGFSCHLLASFAAVALGDLPAAEDFAALGVESDQPGEVVSLQLQLAYVRMLDGRYADALALVRDGESDDWSGRDRLLLAVLDAGLARRSGDTTRLREAWRRADPVLVRHNVSWLLIDPLTELLAAGVKIGNTSRVGPLLESLNSQIADFAPTSPAPSNVAWLLLQLGLAADDPEAVGEAARRLEEFGTPGARAQARLEASPLWTELVAVRASDDATQMLAATETEFIDSAAALADGGEAWEASRLVGAAAIEFEDSGVARRLLERARTFTVDVDEADAEDPLVVLGLSEREADVARLVAEGRTHKETGAQLFISPKTVEHHVARIRQKLGATSRAELLGIIREALGTEH